MKEFLAAHIVETIGIVIAAITAIGVFVGPWFASWRQRKNTEQGRKLRAHLEELKREAELVISSASNLAQVCGNGKLVVSGGSHEKIVSDIEKAKVSASFKAHFPEQAKGLGTLKQKTREHNTNCEKLRQKIKIAFESKGIPVVQNDQGSLPVFTYEASLDAVFNRWKELALNKCPMPDFKEIGSSPVQGGYKMFTRGWGEV